MPELVCLQRPSDCANDGVYVVRIPFKYMLVKDMATWYEYRFIGLKFQGKGVEDDKSKL
jgi:hypothetical protein